MCTCSLSGKCEPSEPDCEQGSSTDRGDIISTSQMSATFSTSPAGLQTDSSTTKGEISVMKISVHAHRQQRPETKRSMYHFTTFSILTRRQI